MSDAPDERPVILVGIDFSPEAEHALAWAAWLARLRHAELRLVHAVAWSEAAEGLDLEQRAVGPLLEASMLRLDGLARAWRDRVPAIGCEARFGQPSEVLLALAGQLRPVAIVVGTRGLRGWRHLLLGSTSERLLGRSPVPVLAVHLQDAEPNEEALRLLAATDFSADAVQALRAAWRLLHPRVGQISLLHAFAAPPVPPAVEGELVAVQILEASRLAAAVRLDAEAKALRDEGIPVVPELVEGEPEDAIVDAAAHHGSDVVVLGSRGRGGLLHLPLGRVTQRVAQAAGAAVLVLPRVAWEPETWSRAEEPALGAVTADQEC